MSLVVRYCPVLGSYWAVTPHFDTILMNNYFSHRYSFKRKKNRHERGLLVSCRTNHLLCLACLSKREKWWLTSIPAIEVTTMLAKRHVTFRSQSLNRLFWVSQAGTRLHPSDYLVIPNNCNLLKTFVEDDAVFINLLTSLT